MLRLPRTMSHEDKKERVRTVIRALGIWTCKDTIIGALPLCSSTGTFAGKTSQHLTGSSCFVKVPEEPPQDSEMFSCVHQRLSGLNTEYISLSVLLTVLTVSIGLFKPTSLGTQIVWTAQRSWWLLHVGLHVEERAPAPV